MTDANANGAPQQQPLLHLCEHPGCAEWGAFGFGPRGIEGLDKPAKWYCAVHRSQGERRIQELSPTA
jgi:hypothetical protein